MLQFNGMDVTFVRSKLITIILLVVIGLLAVPFFLPAKIYQDLIESHLEKSTGLDIKVNGAFDFALFPSMRMDADDIEFTGQLTKNIDTIGTVQKIVIDVDLLQFLTGNIHVNEFLLQGPNATINGDFSVQIPDWIRNNLSAARKEDIRYLEILMHFIEDSVFNIARITEGTLQWNKTPKDQFTAQSLNLSIEKPKEGKDFTVDGNVYINDRSVDLTMRLQRPDDFIRGFRSKLSLQLDSTPLNIHFIGNAAHRQSFVAQGNIRLEIPSTYEFCSWFKDGETCDDNSGNVLVTGDLKLRDQRLQIDDAAYSHNDFEMSANGAIDFKSATPEIIGTVLVPPRPFASLSNSFKGLQQTNLNNLFLDTYDANVDVKYQGLSLASGDTFSPQLKILLNDGRLAITSDKLKMFGGLSNFRLRWHKGIEKGFMDLRLDTHSLDLKRLQKSIGKDYQMTGSLKTSIEVQSQGSSAQALLETAKIHGDFSILDGSFKNLDVVKSLSGEDLKQFEFAEIKGRIKGDRGQISSKDIKFIAPFVTIVGISSLDLLSNTIKIHLKSTIPERKDAAKQEGYVTVSGPLDQLEMFSSVNDGPVAQQEPTDGLHSGLLPYTDGEASPSDDEDIVIEETDLFD